MNWREFPFILILLCYVLGVLLGEWGIAQIMPIAGIFICLLGAYVIAFWTGIQTAAYRFSYLFAIWAWMAFTCLGLWRYESDRVQKAEVAHRFDRFSDSMFIGRVLIREVKLKNTGIQVIGRVELVWHAAIAQGQQVGGDIQLFLEQGNQPAIRGGRTIWVQGRCARIPDNPNPGVFNYAAFLRRKGITHQGYIRADAWRVVPPAEGLSMHRWLFSSQNFCLDQLRTALPQPAYYAIAAALVIGNREQLDPEIRDVFSKTGAMHVLAVSGLHVGMVAWCLSWLLGRFPFTGRLWMATRACIQGVGVWGYVFLCGAGASVVRAGVMFSWMLIGKTIERPGNIWNTLSGSACVLLVYEPQWLFDLGFQLSYLAVGGIVLLEPYLYQLFFFKNRLLDYFWKLTAVGLAAQVVTGPLSVYYFHQFPLGFLLSGWLAVPLGAIVQGLGLGVVLGGMIPVVGPGMGFLLQKSIELLYGGLDWIRNIPGQCMEGLWLDFPVLIWTYLLLIGCISLWIGFEKYWIWVVLSLLGLGVVYRGVRIYREAARRTAICYGIPRASVFEFWEGNRVYILQTGDSTRIQSQTAGIHGAYGVQKIQRVALDTIPAAHSALYQKGPLLIFQGMRFFIWDGSVHSRLLPPIGADYWLLRNDPFLPKSIGTDRLPRKGIIGDGSNKNTRNSYYRSWCTAHRIPYWSTLKQGAWIKTW